MIGSGMALPDHTLVQLFDAQVERTPHGLALHGDDVAVTYEALAAQSRAFAAVLSARGVRRGDVVALWMRRAPSAVAAMLGVLRAGAAYLPLDASDPEDRVRFMVEDSGARVLVTDDARRVLAGVATVSWDNAQPAPEVRLPIVSGGDLAYVIYTSGATGTPKGAGIEHATISALALDQAAGGAHRRSQISILSFDAHVWELWPALVSGGSVHFVPDDVRADVSGLLAWIARARIEWAWLPTPLGELCLRAVWPACELHHLALGGDTLHDVPDAARTFELLNGWGTTETTCVTTLGPVAPGTRPDIGRALPGQVVYVLDGDLAPVPAGATGQLFIGGGLVGRGYLRRPALTAERFVPDPFSPHAGARMYRTGDLGRWVSEDRLEFLGRVDRQVKIHGVRIELDEIERGLRQLAGVRDAVVVARDERGDGKRLIGYVTLEEHAAVGEPSVRAALARTLPGAMIPSRIVVLDAFPLSPSGKLDRRALPDPPAPVTTTAPRSATEHRIAAIWCKVLGLAEVGIHDSFFDLGGHSLQLTSVHRKLTADGVTGLKMTHLFEHPTIAALAAFVDAAPERGHAAERGRTQASTRLAARSGHEQGKT